MADEITCFLCNGQGAAKESPSDATTVQCHTCGAYAATGSAQEELRRTDDRARAEISAITRERVIHGLPPLVLCSSAYRPDQRDSRHVALDEARARFPRLPDIAERVDRSVTNLVHMSTYFGSIVRLTDRDYPVFFAENVDAMIFMRSHLAADGLVEPVRDAAIRAVRVTAAGWGQYERLQRSGRDSKRAFVAMWFDRRLNEAWDNGFRGAIHEAGYVPERVDLSEHNEKICDRIIAEIKRSRFVVADFTGHRGGVYFEAGFAMGLGLPVIWTCHEDDIPNCHFDTRQYNHISWTDPADLHRRLFNRIRATIPPP